MELKFFGFFVKGKGGKYYTYLCVGEFRVFSKVWEFRLGVGDFYVF